MNSNNALINGRTVIDGWSPLHALVALSEQGSFTAAAGRLGISKAAMSQRIRELEQTAGVTLVQRTTRSVRLTEAGQRLADAARPAFEALTHALLTVREQAGAPQGLVRVTAPVALARQQLVAHLPDFLRRHPGVRIELQMSDRLSSLAAEGFDLAIRHTAQPPDTHVAWRLCGTQTLLVASPEYVQRAPALRHPGDIARHNCLYYPRPQETPAWAFEPRGSQQAASRVTVPIAGNFSANNSESLREAALAGLGLTLLPDFSARHSLASGALVALLPAWRPVSAFAQDIYALRPYSTHVPRAVTAFVEFLRALWADGFGAEATARR